MGRQGKTQQAPPENEQGNSAAPVIETDTPGPEEQVLDIPVPQGGMARPEPEGLEKQVLSPLDSMDRPETVSGVAGQAPRPPEAVRQEEFHIEPGETWWSKKYPVGLYEVLVRFNAPYTPGNLYLEIIRETPAESVPFPPRPLASLYPEDMKYGGPLSFRTDVPFNLTIKNTFAEKVTVSRLDIHRIAWPSGDKEEAPPGGPNPSLGGADRAR